MDGELPGWGFREGDAIVPGRHAVELLGGGHRYEAYLAWDDHLGALAVAKVVRPHLAGDAGALAGLAAEAGHLRRLAHPMLLRAFDARLDGERPHLLLELIEGPRLSTLIRRYGVALEQLLPLALNLCSVLGYLARERTVHLDVKPSNLVMSDVPKLIDLSVAKRIDELGTIASPIGTDAYIPPEQCDPARFAAIGPASDVWGLGATLYEALARERPFGPRQPDGGLLERFPQLHRAPKPLPRDVPAPLAELVYECLSPDPADRPTASELADRLEPVVAALPGPRIGPFRPGWKGMLRDLDVR
jgi:eukaryotic-like serine/threonine-protein kinase